MNQHYFAVYTLDFEVEAGYSLVALELLSAEIESKTG
jgi:hypothetical protein